MILLPCDEAFAFDYLAILYTKRDRNLAVEKEIKKVEMSLKAQIHNIDDVLASKQFDVLSKANESTFDAVAKAGKTPVQIANHARYKAKQSLQRKFWPTRPLMERKRRYGI
jgi:hypothetical protein